MKRLFASIAGVLMAFGLMSVPSTATTTGTDVTPATNTHAISNTQVLTSSSLAASGNYKSSWIDTTQGQKFVAISVFTDQNGSFTVEYTDDQSQPPISTNTYVVTGGTSFNSGVIYIPTRYWRVDYNNGATAQTKFEVMETASQVAANLLQVYGTGGIQVAYNPSTLSATVSCPQCALLNQANTFTGGLGAPFFNATAAAGGSQFQIGGNTVLSEANDAVSTLLRPYGAGYVYFANAANSNIWGYVNGNGFSTGYSFIYTGQSGVAANGNLAFGPPAWSNGAGNNVFGIYANGTGNQVFTFSMNGSPYMSVGMDGGLNVGGNTDPGVGNITASGSATFSGKMTSSGALVNTVGSGSQNQALAIYDTTASAPNPYKYIRVSGGNLQITNSAFSAIPFTLSDSGNLTLTGTLSASGVTDTGTMTIYDGSNNGTFYTGSGGAAGAFFLRSDGGLNVAKHDLSVYYAQINSTSATFGEPVTVKGGITIPDNSSVATVTLGNQCTATSSANCDGNHLVFDDSNWNGTAAVTNTWQFYHGGANNFNLQYNGSTLFQWQPTGGLVATTGLPFVTGSSSYGATSATVRGTITAGPTGYLSLRDDGTNAIVTATGASSSLYLDANGGSKFAHLDGSDNFTLDQSGSFLTGSSTYGATVASVNGQLTASNIYSTGYLDSYNNTGNTEVRLFADVGGQNWLESGNAGFTGNSQLNLTGYNGGQGSTLNLKFNTIVAQGVVIATSDFYSMHNICGSCGGTVANASFSATGGSSAAGIGWNADGGGGIALYTAYAGNTIATFDYWNGTAWTQPAKIWNDGSYRVGSSIYGGTSATINGSLSAGTTTLGNTTTGTISLSGGISNALASISTDANSTIYLMVPNAASQNNPFTYQFTNSNYGGFNVKNGADVIVTGLAAPSAPTLGQAAGGTIAATTYYVKIAYQNGYGGTTASAESSLAVSANNVLTITSPPASGNANGWNVYVGTSSGSETLQASGIAIGTNWTEPTTGLVSGSALPTENYSIGGLTAGNSNYRGHYATVEGPIYLTGTVGSGTSSNYISGFGPDTIMIQTSDTSGSVYFRDGANTNGTINSAGFTTGSSIFGPTSATVNGPLSTTNLDLPLQVSLAHPAANHGVIGTDNNGYLTFRAYNTNGFQFQNDQGTPTTWASLNSSGWNLGSSNYGPSSATINGNVTTTGGGSVKSSGCFTLSANSNGSPLICEDNNTIASPGFNFITPAAAPTYGYRFFTNGTGKLLFQMVDTGATFSVPLSINGNISIPDGTSASTLLLGNTGTATSSTNHQSQTLKFDDSTWNGSAAVSNNWTMTATSGDNFNVNHNGATVFQIGSGGGVHANAGGFYLDATGTNSIYSATTGANTAFVMNATGSPTGDMLDIQKAGTNVFQVQNSGGFIAKGVATLGGSGLLTAYDDGTNAIVKAATGAKLYLDANGGSQYMHLESSDSLILDQAGSFITGSSTYGATSATVNGTMTDNGETSNGQITLQPTGTANATTTTYGSNNLLFANSVWNGTAPVSYQWTLSEGGGDNFNVSYYNGSTWTTIAQLYASGGLDLKGYSLVSGSSTYGPTSANIYGAATVGTNQWLTLYDDGSNVVIKNTHASSTYIDSNTGSDFMHLDTGDNLTLDQGGTFKTGYSMYGATSASVNGGVTAAGAFVSTGSSISASSVGITADGGSPAGMYLNVPASSVNGYKFLIGGSLLAQIDNAGNFKTGSSTYGASSATVNGSVTIGTGGNSTAGSIYSDSNWGMLFVAKQASPAVALFGFEDSTNTQKAKILTDGSYTTGSSTYGPTGAYTNGNYASTTSAFGMGNNTPSSGFTTEIRSSGAGVEALKISAANASSSDQATIRLVGQRSDGNGSSTFSGTVALAHLETDASVVNGVRIGRMLFGANGGGTAESNLLWGGEITGVTEGAWTGTSTPFALAFNVGNTPYGINAANGEPGYEAMRLTSSGNLNLEALSAPATPTLGQSAGGTIAATTYYVKVTYKNANGETTASSEASLAVSANNVLTVTSPAAFGNATSYNVYVSTATGTETKQGNVAIGTTWTEPTTGLVSGAALPSVNTALGQLSVGNSTINGWLALKGTYGTSSSTTQIYQCAPPSCGSANMMFNIPSGGGLFGFTVNGTTESYIDSSGNYKAGSSVYGPTSATVNGTMTATTFSGSGASLTSIPNSALVNSTISGVALGGTLNTLTIGSHLSGGSYNGSAAVTIATDATNANTASTIVARDASGNFSAGTISVSGLNDSGLAASSNICTDASKNLTTTGCASGGSDLASNNTFTGINTYSQDIIDTHNIYGSGPATFTEAGGNSAAGLGWNGNGDGSATIYTAYTNPTNTASFYYYNGTAYTESSYIKKDGTYVAGSTSIGPAGASFAGGISLYGAGNTFQGTDFYLGSSGTTAGTIHFRTNGYSNADTVTIDSSGNIVASGTLNLGGGAGGTAIGLVSNANIVGGNAQIGFGPGGTIAGVTCSSVGFAYAGHYWSGCFDTSSNFGVGGYIASAGSIYAGGSTACSSTGDICTQRSSATTTGVIYLGSGGTHYVYFDGSNYQMPNGAVYATAFVNNSRAALKHDIHSLQTVDALGVLHNCAWSSFRYKTGPQDVHYGFIADRCDSLLSGPKRDHFDAETTSTFAALAVLQEDAKVKKLEAQVSSLQKQVITLQAKHDAAHGTGHNIFWYLFHPWVAVGS